MLWVRIKSLENEQNSSYYKCISYKFYVIFLTFELMYLWNKSTIYFSSINSQDQQLGSKTLFYRSRFSQIHIFVSYHPVKTGWLKVLAITNDNLYC